MALYQTQVNTDPLVSDVNQLVNVFNGNHDIGQITLAPPLSAPSTTGFSLGLQAGGALGVGTYQYVFTYVTGQYKSDGTTIVITGETVASSSLSITTTSGNTTVKVTLPVPGPASIIATRIYRTAVGGSTYGLIATVKDGTTSYVDSTADGSLGVAPSSNNTTGISINESALFGRREMIPNYNQYATNVGNNNVYTTLQLKRPDGSLYLQSVLSNPDTNGNYQTDTWTFYATDGVTVVTTHVWTLTWDSNSKITSKVMSS